MAEIEHQLGLPLQPNETDHDLQLYVDRALRQLGVDANLITNGVVMIDRTDDEGNSRRCALVVDPGDFGTEKLNVLAVEVEFIDEERQTQPDDIEVTLAEPEAVETWEQIHARKKLLQIVEDLTETFGSALEESAQHSKGRDAATSEFLQLVRSKIDNIFPRGQDQPHINSHEVARLLSEWSNLSIKALNDERGDAEYDVARSRHYKAAIDEAGTEAGGKISRAKQIDLEPKLHQLMSGVDALIDNRTYNRSSVDQLRSFTAQLITTLEDAQYSTTGDEQLRWRLLSLLGDADVFYE